MLPHKKRSVFKSSAKYLLMVFLCFGMLNASTKAFSQTETKQEAAARRAEKRKDIKKFFKKLNPFKKHTDDGVDDNSTASTGNKTADPQPVNPPPVPAPPAPSPSKQSTSTAVKKKTKKTTVKKTTTAQPFM